MVRHIEETRAGNVANKECRGEEGETRTTALVAGKARTQHKRKSNQTKCALRGKSTPSQMHHGNHKHAMPRKVRRRRAYARWWDETQIQIGKFDMLIDAARGNGGMAGTVMRARTQRRNKDPIRRYGRQYNGAGARANTMMQRAPPPSAYRLTPANGTKERATRRHAPRAINAQKPQQRYIIKRHGNVCNASTSSPNAHAAARRTKRHHEETTECMRRWWNTNTAVNVQRAWDA